MEIQKTLTSKPEDKNVGIPIANRKINGRFESYKKSFGNLRGTPRPQIFPVGETGENIDGTQETTRRNGAWFRSKHNSISRSLRVGGSGREENLIASTISNRYYKDGSENLIVMQELRKDGFRQMKESNVSLTLTRKMGTGGNNIPMVMACLTPDRINKRQNGRRFKEDGEPSFTLMGQDIHGVAVNNKIRRLTPLECERLMGFPDNWTSSGLTNDGKEVSISDTQRYKQCGNSVVVPVIRFLGQQIRKSWSFK